jgi:hypothetical protein
MTIGRYLISETGGGEEGCLSFYRRLHICDWDIGGKAELFLLFVLVLQKRNGRK